MHQCVGATSLFCSFFLLILTVRRTLWLLKNDNTARLCLIQIFGEHIYILKFPKLQFFVPSCFVFYKSRFWLYWRLNLQYLHFTILFLLCLIKLWQQHKKYKKRKCFGLNAHSVNGALNHQPLTPLVSLAAPDLTVNGGRAQCNVRHLVHGQKSVLL